MSPPAPPVIIGEKAVFHRKTNKKGKPLGPAVLTGYEFEFSSALDPASATNSANYEVDSVMTKRVKKKTVRILKPITNFTVSYINDAATKEMMLRIARDYENLAVRAEARSKCPPKAE